MAGFNTYGNVLLRIEPTTLSEFEIGQTVPIADGIYCGEEGFIVIQDGRLVMETQTIAGPSGQAIFPEKCLEGTRPWLPGDAREEG